MQIPLFDTATPLEPFRERLVEAAMRTIARGAFILGPEVETFEREFASYLGVRHAIGVANGTDALTIALRAMGIGPGDDVVVPSFTFYASVEAIVHAGARPVFCDVDRETMIVTPETVRRALTPRTKAVIAVDLFGNVAPVAEIEALGVPVLEDAAQAAGSRSTAGRAGALGTAATFSFYPSKNLPALGDGGAVITDDDEIADRAGLLRFHGSRDRGTYESVGYNSRLDEMQAAFLRILLPELDEWVAARGRAAGHYHTAGLGELVALPQPAPGAVPAWHVFAIRSPGVDRIARALTHRGIGNKFYYRVPVHRQPAMAALAQGVTLPATDELAGIHLAIPMSPVLSENAAAEVTEAIREGLSAASPG